MIFLCVGHCNRFHFIQRSEFAISKVTAWPSKIFLSGISIPRGPADIAVIFYDDSVKMCIIQYISVATDSYE